MALTCTPARSLVVLSLSFISCGVFGAGDGLTGGSYGPFWISTTLIFLLGATGNFATFLSYMLVDRGDEWVYDFSKVTIGAIIIYCYILIIPILFWTGFKYLEAPIGVMDSYCLFGYAMFPYVPASVCGRSVECEGGC